LKKEERKYRMRNRIERINQLLQQKIAEILAKDFFVEGALITVQKVDIRKDLKYARIRVSILPYRDSGKIIKILKQQTPRIQEKLGNTLRMKFTPQVKFVVDSSEENADRIERILKHLKD